jgi:hypothetical protein
MQGFADRPGKYSKLYTDSFTAPGVFWMMLMFGLLSGSSPDNDIFFRPSVFVHAPSLQMKCGHDSCIDNYYIIN